MANNFFQGVSVGAPGKSSIVYSQAPTQGESKLSQEARQQHQAGIMARPQQKKEEEQQSSNNFNRNQFQQTPTQTTPTASSPTGSSLVAGGPGTGMAASYAPSFGLQGAVSSGGLGSYAGGAGGLMTASGTGASGASFGSLGAASSGLTYGGATGAATTGAGSSFFGLGGASAGMTYGGAAAGAGAATAGSGAAAGGAGSLASAGGAGVGTMGASAGTAMFSNPITAIIAAAIIGSNYLDNKGISSWGDTIKGQAGGNIVDYYSGRSDGKEHGILSKVFDQDGYVGQLAKGFTDIGELDWKNGFKSMGGAFKSLFKGQLF